MNKGRARQIAVLLMISLLLSGSSFSQGKLGDWNVQAAEKKTTPSEWRATPSQVDLSQMADNSLRQNSEKMDDLEDISLSLADLEVYYGDQTQYEITGVNAYMDWEIQAYPAGEEGNTKVVGYYTQYTENGVKGTLFLTRLEAGLWKIVVLVDGEKAAETEILIKPTEYTLTFTQRLNKYLGEEDPTVLPRDAVKIVNQDGFNMWIYESVQLLREQGEEPGSYKITGIKTGRSDIVYLITDNEYAYLDILKKESEDCGKIVYLDANKEWEVSVNLYDAQTSSGEYYLPRDMVNPKIYLENAEEVLKDLDGQPEIHDGQVTIRIPKKVAERRLPVPFRISSDNYQDIVFTITVMADYVNEPTEEEIKEYFQKHPFDLGGSVTFEEEPGFSPYKAGKISESSQQDGLNALNFVRYIAGLPEVKNDDELSYYAQAGCVINAKNDQLSHHPKQPSDMPDEFFEDGYLGTSSSNISHRRGSLSQNVIEGYMYDGTLDNMDTVGHRRWCLNPAMGLTGWGYYQSYGAMYAFDESAVADVVAGYVPWPARKMPYEYFSGPWSIQFRRETFADIEEDVEVTMTTSSGEKYIFSREHADGYFRFDNNNYGWCSAVIFQPDQHIGRNETVTIQVTGLHRPDGTETEIEYTVDFFSMPVPDGSSSSSEGGSSSGGGGSSSGGGGGSSSGGGGSSSGGGFGSGGPGATGITGPVIAGNGPGTTGITTVGTHAYGGTWEWNGEHWKLRMFNSQYAASRWALVEGKWYLFDSQSNMLTGWQIADGKWYYMNPDGSMATGWCFENGKWYYLNGDGSMATGWVLVGGKWYYLSEDGSMLTGWISINDKYYCLAADGALYVNTYTPDGYYVDSDGVRSRV